MTSNANMALKSPSFKMEESLPRLYTCDGKNISPPLIFHNVPSSAKSLVLIHDDPQAVSGNWTHWILFNLPPFIKHLTEGCEILPQGTQQGKNSWGKAGYGGACPPDKEHLYEFKLYALDCLLDLSGDVSKEAVENAMKGHILEMAKLTVPYKRPFH